MYGVEGRRCPACGEMEFTLASPRGFFQRRVLWPLGARIFICGSCGCRLCRFETWWRKGLLAGGRPDAAEAQPAETGANMHYLPSQDQQSRSEFLRDLEEQEAKLDARAKAGADQS